MSDTAPRTRRSGGRSGNSRRSSQKAIEQSAWRIPYNTDKPTEPLPPEGVEAVHNAAMEVLETIGIEFLNDEALDYLRKAGCKVQDQNVKMDRDWVMEMIALAPSQFDITPRNPDRKITIGGKNMVFVNVSSPPNAMDLDRGHRVGDMESFTDFLKFTQYFNCIHVAGGYPVEPVDVHASIRHLDCVYQKLTLTDKAIHAYSLGSERVEDVFTPTSTPPLRSNTTRPCLTEPCVLPDADNRLWSLLSRLLEPWRR